MTEAEDKAREWDNSSNEARLAAEAFIEKYWEHPLFEKVDGEVLTCTFLAGFLAGQQSQWSDLPEDFSILPKKFQLMAIDEDGKEYWTVAYICHQGLVTDLFSAREVGAYTKWAAIQLPTQGGQVSEKINEFAFFQEFIKFVQSFKTKKACAEHLGISRVHLYDLLNMNKPFSPRIAEKVGYRREVVVRRDVQYLPLLKKKGARP